MSSDHFSVDGTLLEAWASHKSFKRKGGSDGPVGPGGRNAEADFRGEKRSNETHRSTTDPEALLARKSNNTAARLCFAGHLLIENRNALIVDAELTRPTALRSGPPRSSCSPGYPDGDGDGPWLRTRPTTQKRS